MPPTSPVQARAGAAPGLRTPLRLSPPRPRLPRSPFTPLRHAASPRPLRAGSAHMRPALAAGGSAGSRRLRLTMVVHSRLRSLGAPSPWPLHPHHPWPAKAHQLQAAGPAAAPRAACPASTSLRGGVPRARPAPSCIARTQLQAALAVAGRAALAGGVAVEGGEACRHPGGAGLGMRDAGRQWQCRLVPVYAQHVRGTQCMPSM